MDYIQELEKSFSSEANDSVAAGQKAYMKNKFEYWGLKSPVRKELQKPFLLKAYLPEQKHLERIMKTLWKKPQREYQYFAQELMAKYSKKLEKKDIDLIEYLVINKSWWDTIDFIASNIIGPYMKKFPEERDGIIERWLASENMWLQRCCLLFQLKYKMDLDKDVVVQVIHYLLGSKEFFINKAIGWILREYSKVNPVWVMEFAEKTDLSNLSRKEAIRLIK